jgi:hypothetical protein
MAERWEWLELRAPEVKLAVAPDLGTAIRVATLMISR